MNHVSDPHQFPPVGGLSRRTFLRNVVCGGLPIAAVGPVAASGAPVGTPDSAPPEASARKVPELPRRKLGRNGPEVTVVAQGGSINAHSPHFLELAWAHGIRYFDASHTYINGKCERNIAAFLDRDPDRRKDLFLVTKEHPKTPRDLLTSIDNRLAALHTTYLDLFFIHGIGPDRYGAESLNWPKSDEWRAVADQLKESGKVRMVGFSCHNARLTDYMSAAAEGGFLDALMIAHDPFHEKGGVYDQAMEACHAAGIGLVAMKNMRSLGDVSARLPELDRLGLTTREALLHTILSDARISALCIESANVAHLAENTKAVLTFDPSRERSASAALREHVRQVSHSTCPGCDACRSIAGESGAALLDIARYVAYYERDGKTDARALYRHLSPAECSRCADLAEQARASCRYHVDYPLILRKADHYFANG